MFTCIYEINIYVTGIHVARINEKIHCALWAKDNVVAIVEDLLEGGRNNGNDKQKGWNTPCPCFYLV